MPARLSLRLPRCNPDVAAAMVLLAYGLCRATRALPDRPPHPLVLAIIIACSIYLATRNRLKDRPVTGRHHGLAVRAASDIMFALSIASALIIYAHSDYVLPVHYFAALTLSAASILGDIAMDRHGATAIPLTKIVILGLLLRAMAYWQFPGPIGSDPWRHLLTIDSTATAGHVIDVLPDAMGNANSYSAIPLFHLYGAMALGLGGLDAKASAFIVASVPHVLSVLFIYLIGGDLHGRNAGLLAALFYCTADYALLWSVQIIPMTLAIAISACLLWWLLLHRPASRARVALALVFILALILCHTVASFVMIVALTAALVASRLLTSGLLPMPKPAATPLLTPSIIGLYLVFMLLWWMHMPGQSGSTFFAVQTGKLAAVTASAGMAQTPAAESASVRPYAGQLYDFAGMAMLIGLGIYAALSAIALRRPGNHLLMAAALGAMVLVQAAGPAPLQEAVIGARWIVFEYVLLAVLSGWLLSLLLNRISTAAARLALVLMLCLVYVLPMMTNSVSNQASPFRHTLVPRMGYTSSEQAAWRTLLENLQLWPVSDAYYISAMAAVTSAEDCSALAATNHEVFIERHNYLARPELNERFCSVIGDIRNVHSGSYRLAGWQPELLQYGSDLAASGGAIYVNNTTRMVLAVP